MKSKIFILGILLGVGLFSCKKDKVYSENIEGTPTSYPVISLIGGEVTTINVGTNFVDPGYSITDSLYPNPAVTVEGDIDINTPGMYNLLYTAINSKGFKSTASRFVAVTNMDDAFDISGDYLRGTAGLGTMEKISRGAFTFTNCGGLPSGYPSFYYPKLTFCFTDSFTLVCPPQPASSGTAYFKDAEIDYTAPTTFRWILKSAGFGEVYRVFIKQ